MQRLRFQWLVSVATGRALTADAISPEIRQAAVDFADVSQQWSIAPNSTADPQTVLVVHRATGQAIDVPNSHFANGTPLQRFPVNRGANQLWRRQDPGGLFLSSSHQNFVWDIPFGEGDKNLQLFTRNGDANQQWTITQPPGQVVDFPAFKVRSAVGKVLDVPGASQDEAVPIQQFADGGEFAFNQLWEITDANFHVIPNFNPRVAQVIRLVCVSSGKSLQVIGRPSGPGPVTQGTISAVETGQRWHIEPDGIGVRLESEVNRDLVLDLPGGSTANVQLQVFPRNGGANQRWTFV